MIERLPARIDPLNKTTWIDIYLPDDYFGSDRRYPVLYMFDGQNLFFDQQASFGRTWPQREATAIIGSSMGGLMAFYAGIHHNDVFSKAACLSPSLFLCQEEISQDFEDCALNPDTRIYWSFGSKELPARQRVEAEMALDEYAWSLKRRGGYGRVKIWENAAHNEESWGNQMHEVLHFLFNDPRDLDTGQSE